MDKKVRYIDPGGIYARAGEWVTCESGHVICMFARKVALGDTFDESALQHWTQEAPKLGQMRVPGCDICGAEFARGPSFHFYDGWRTTAANRPGWWRRFLGVVGIFVKL